LHYSYTIVTLLSHYFDTVVTLLLPWTTFSTVSMTSGLASECRGADLPIKGIFRKYETTQ
jgi:hypothetical protein